MKKLLTFLSYLVTALAACALTLYFTAPKVSKLDELQALIAQRFIGEWEEPTLMDGAAEGMIAALGDRWSYYIPASEYEAHMEQVENAYVGIGVTITADEEAGGLRVTSVTPGGSAQAAGIQAEDMIIAIEGTSTAEMSTTDARNLVRGEEGTTVTLTIRRGANTFDLTIPRQKIETEVASGELLDGGIGLITISNFDKRCADESIAAIEALQAQGASKLIFDVRNNPGGYAAELVKLLDYLLPEGDLFRTVDYAGKEQVDTSDPNCLQLPMAVLCNEDSYSAAEFFAAAMQEYEAAVIVGQPTCGKGYFQATFQLSDGSAAAISIGKYFTPKGNSLIDVGIQPDIPVSVEDDTYLGIYYGTLDHAADPQLQAAIAALAD